MSDSNSPCPWQRVLAQRLAEDEVSLVELAAAAAAAEIDAATPPDADGVHRVDETDWAELPTFAYELLDRLPDDVSWSGLGELEKLVANAINRNARDALEVFLDECLDHQGAIASLELDGGFTSGGDFVHEVRAEGYAWYFDRSDNTGDEHFLRRAYPLGDDAGRRAALVEVAERLAGADFEYDEDAELRAAARRVREEGSGPWDTSFESWVGLLEEVSPIIGEVAEHLATARSAQAAEIEAVLATLVEAKYPKSAREKRIGWDLWWDNKMRW